MAPWRGTRDSDRQVRADSQRQPERASGSPPAESELYVCDSRPWRPTGIGVTGIFGRSSATIDGTLTAGFGGFAATRMGSIGDSITSVGDLYPMITLKWNSGVNNYMTYVTGDIPVGAYDPSRIANLGIGHGAIDAGGGYTYLNPATGLTLSGVAGFTYNFKNPDTQVQMESTSISTGAPRNFFRSEPSSDLLDTPISKSPMTPVAVPFSAASDRGFSGWVPSGATSFPSATCRDI
jgi:Putative MetA-pathway of phenol degradation